MTTVRSGIPTVRRPLTAEQRIARAVRKSEEAALVAVAVDSRVDDVLSGDETFTAVNVAGTDVAPFLAKTDGEKLTDALGLAEGLVGTSQIAAGAVTSAGQATSASFIDINFTTEVTLATQAVTLAADEYVDLLGTFGTLAVGGDPANIGDTAAQIVASLYRDSTKIAEGPVASVIKGITLNASTALPQVDEPSAGSYSYTLRARLTTTGSVTQATAGNRSLRALVFKR